jgi:hypothetical protein
MHARAFRLFWFSRHTYARSLCCNPFLGIPDAIEKNLRERNTHPAKRQSTAYRRAMLNEMVDQVETGGVTHIKNTNVYLYPVDKKRLPGLSPGNMADGVIADSVPVRDFLLVRCAPMKLKQLRRDAYPRRVDKESRKGPMGEIVVIFVSECVCEWRI